MRGGTQKGTEVHECSFQHFHSLYILWLHFSTAIFYILYTFSSYFTVKLFWDRKCFFDCEQRKPLWQLLISMSLYQLYSNKKLNWQSNKNMKIRDDLNFALQTHLTLQWGGSHPVLYKHNQSNSIPYIQSCCTRALRGKSPTIVHSQCSGTSTNLLCFLWSHLEFQTQ